MFRQIAAMAPRCADVLAASNGEHGSRLADAKLPVEQSETHHLKFTPPSAYLSTLLLEGTPTTSDQNNDRRTVHAFAEYWSVSPIACSITLQKSHSVNERSTC